MFEDTWCSDSRKLVDMVVSWPNGLGFESSTPTDYYYHKKLLFKLVTFSVLIWVVILEAWTGLVDQSCLVIMLSIIITKSPLTNPAVEINID